LSFDGSSNLATINNGIFNVNGSFTLEMWVYVTGSSASAPFGIGGGAGSWSTTNGHLMLLATKNGSGNLGFQWNTSGSVSQISGSALSTNTWHWIVVGYNGTTTRLWLDGSSVGTSTNGYTNPSTNNLVKLGNNASLDQAFTGYIDDFRFTQGLDRYGVSNSTITPPSSALPTY
jgi:hypothetical protein